GLREYVLDEAGGHAGDRLGDAAVTAHRQTGQHVVLGVPARTTGALDDEGADLAVGGAKTLAVLRRNLDSRQHGGVEARLVEHHDDVGQLAGWLAGRAGRQRQTVRGRAV